MAVWIGYCFLGFVVGVLAGMLGVGGGVIIVPALYLLFASQQIPHDVIPHMAVGTSLACIVFTSLSSMRAHHGRNSVDWTIVWRITPAIVTGTLIGSWVAILLPVRFLQWVFVVFLFSLTVQMFRTPRERAPGARLGPLGLSVAGGLIGSLSSMVGIGGGSMIVPLLTWCNVAMRMAIGTSAAIGFFIAVSGSAGSIITGLRVSGLPPHTLGYVHVPALAGIAMMSVLTAPLGARLAYRLPVPLLRRGFAILLFIIGCRLILDLI